MVHKCPNDLQLYCTLDFLLTLRYTLQLYCTLDFLLTPRYVLQYYCTRENGPGVS